MLKLFISILLFVTLAWSAEEAQKVTSKNTKEKFVTRKSVSADYNSWFETIRVKGNGSPYDTKALLYGTGISFEYLNLKQEWGWGVNVGILQGYGTVGDASDTSSYYAKRVPLSSIRGGGRIFQRINPRFDLGVAGTLLLATKSWPAENGFTVEAPSGPMIGGFLDSRWRLDGHWDLIQALGTYSRGPSLAWRLGASYTF